MVFVLVGTMLVLSLGKLSFEQGSLYPCYILFTIHTESRCGACALVIYLLIITLLEEQIWNCVAAIDVYVMINVRHRV